MSETKSKKSAKASVCPHKSPVAHTTSPEAFVALRIKCDCENCRRVIAQREGWMPGITDRAQKLIEAE